MLAMKRRRVLATIVVGLTLPGARGAHAQTYPARPIRILVGFSPGGAVDIVARAVGQHIGAGLGQPVIIDNKPGAGTNIAMRTLIDSPPDGYTLMLTANSIAANQTLYQPAPYDMARDFTPISLIGRVPVVIVTQAQSEIGSLARLVAMSKAAPRSINFGTPGNGSTPHLAVELFARAAGIELTHVPYKGGAPALNDVLAGHIQTVAVNALEAQPHVRSGRLRVLAVLTPARSSIFPDVPSIAESGYAGFEASVWYALVGPAGLPAPVVARLHAEVQKALAQADVLERLTNAGGEVLPGPREAAVTLLNSEKARYEKLIREARILPD